MLTPGHDPWPDPWPTKFWAHHFYLNLPLLLFPWFPSPLTIHLPLLLSIKEASTLIQLRGAVEARRAHNPEVTRSKRVAAIDQYFCESSDRPSLIVDKAHILPFKKFGYTDTWLR